MPNRGLKNLNMMYTLQKVQRTCPCIIIIHGGGWASNDEDIMRGMARELTKDGKFVVFSIDYRWVQKLDGGAEKVIPWRTLLKMFTVLLHTLWNMLPNTVAIRHGLH